jgi:multidrug efflux system membrane fusion protein
MGEYDLAQTVVRAPFDGRVTNLDIAEGEFAATGRPLFTLIDTRNWYVIANFRETALRGIRPGMIAEVYLMADADRRFTGIVDSIGFGVFPEEGGSSAAGLPRVPRSINWVRVAQRFPVRIRVDDPPSELFRVGASAVALIPAAQEGSKSATASGKAETRQGRRPCKSPSAPIWRSRVGSISGATSSRHRPVASTQCCGSSLGRRSCSSPR